MHSTVLSECDSLPLSRIIYMQKICTVLELNVKNDRLDGTDLFFLGGEYTGVIFTQFNMISLS